MMMVVTMTMTVHPLRFAHAPLIHSPNKRSRHGRGGPIKTSPPLYIDPLAPYFLEACRIMGLPLTDVRLIFMHTNCMLVFAFTIN